MAKKEKVDRIDQMADSMKIFIGVAISLPTLFCIIMAGVLAYEGKDSGVWGPFIFASCFFFIGPLAYMSKLMGINWGALLE